MRNYFTLGGTDCRTYGVYISGQGTFNSPARAADMLSVPGRNGDLIGTGSRLENAELIYPAFIYADFANNLAAFRAFLLSDPGYRKLVDTYHPDEYRMAAYNAALQPEVMPTNDAGTFDIVFNVKPQRYLNSGDTVLTFTANDWITNPTLFESKPLLRIYGTGGVRIGDNTISLSANDEYTDVDCDIMYAYKGSTSKNQYVSVSGIDFPTIPPGRQRVALGTNITKVEITPRWWTV